MSSLSLEVEKESGLIDLGLVVWRLVGYDNEGVERGWNDELVF